MLCLINSARFGLLHWQRNPQQGISKYLSEMEDGSKEGREGGRVRRRERGRLVFPDALRCQNQALRPQDLASLTQTHVTNLKVKGARRQEPPSDPAPCSDESQVCPSVP